MKRLSTAVALIAFAVYVIFLAPFPVFLATTLLMSLLCYWEFSGLVQHHGFPRPGVFGVLAGLVLLFRPQNALLGVFLLMVLSMVVSLRKDSLRDVLPDIGSTFFGAFYSFVPWHFAAELRRESVHLLLFALALNWVGDTAAFFVGKRFGRHRLAPVVSPKKSWEGAAASVAGSVLLGFLYLGNALSRIPFWQVALMAIFGNIAGQFGDLAESAFKRGANVKDSGSMLPGHGGVLDRLDSSLFAMPVVYAIYYVTNIQKF